MNAILEENRRLKFDNEKLMTKLAESKGFLKDTLERLKSNHSSSRESLRAHTPKWVATVSTYSAGPNPGSSAAPMVCSFERRLPANEQERRDYLKQEFLEFSRTQSSKKPRQQQMQIIRKAS